MRVRTILWDLDRTVWLYNENGPIVLSQSLKIEDKKTFEHEYYKMWGNLLDYFEEKRVTYEEMLNFIENQMPILSAYSVKPERFLETIKQEKQNIVRINEEAKEVLDYAKENKIQNLAVTDWFEEHQKSALSEIRVLEYFEKIYACDNGYFKNSKEKITELERELAGKEKSEIILIGDSLISDICFAKRLGVRSIWYNPKGKENTTPYNPTYEVDSLTKVKEIL